MCTFAAEFFIFLHPYMREFIIADNQDITKAGDGEKRMYIGTRFAGEKFIDCLERCEEEVIIDNEGYGNFKLKGKGASVWIKI